MIYWVCVWIDILASSNTKLRAKLNMLSIMSAKQQRFVIVRMLHEYGLKADKYGCKLLTPCYSDTATTQGIRFSVGV